MSFDPAAGPSYNSLALESSIKIKPFVLAKMPPGYTRRKPVGKPKLGPLLSVIDAILEADRTAPAKQRHTAKRIFERLRDEQASAVVTRW